MRVFSIREFMAPDRASAKLSRLLKAQGFITRLPSSTESLSQVPTYPLCRPRTSLLKRTDTQLHFLLSTNASLSTETYALNFIPKLCLINGLTSAQLLKTAPVYRRHIRMVFSRCTQSSIAATNQLGSSTPIRSYANGSLLISRCLTAMASQTTETPTDSCSTFQAPKMHTTQSQVSYGDSKATSAKTTGKEAGGKQADQDEVLRSFEALLARMEASGGSGDQRLGATCLRLAQLCDSAGVEPTRILSYGQRAMRVFKSAKVSWEHVACLHVIGHAYFKMGDFKNTVAHLEQSASLLEKAKANVSEKDVDTLVHARESLLGQAKMALGKFRETIPHFQNYVNLAQKLLEPGNPDLGVAYLQAAKAYKQAKDPEEAIRLCIKAVNNHASYYGPKSSQAAEIRRFMAVVYFDLKEYENSLLECKIVRPMFEALGRLEDVASLDLVAVESLLELERFDDAISKLKGVVDNTLETSPSHGNAMVMLAKAYAIMKEHENAIKYSKMALHVLDKQQSSTDNGSSLVNLALVFQRQQEIELATSTYKKALEVFGKFSGHQADAAIADIQGQIGFLLLHMEKVEEAIPFLERSVSKKKAIHGANSEELLDVHNHLGVAYSEEGKLDEALKHFEAAKTILCKSSMEVDSLTISIYSNLSNMYSVFSRFDEAITCQKIVIDSIKRNIHVETVVSLEEAKNTLEDLQREADAHKKESAHGQEK